MKVGIVGGNGQVGTELAVLLRADGHTVVPIVRSRRAGAFLGYHGFDCRIGDVTDRKDASRLLEDVDIVVIAAYASASSRNVLGYKEAWQTNTAIVKNCVAESPNRATLIYFSTVSAFGNERYSSLLKGRLNHYTISKRSLEKKFLDAARDAGKDGYALRLGYVQGPLQSKTRHIKQYLSEFEKVVVKTEQDAGSNVVHTVTIKDAIEKCGRTAIEPGRYTLINNPRWTWGDVFDYYCPPNVTLEYRLSSNATFGSKLMKSIVDRGSGFLIDQKDKLMSFQLLLPTFLNERIVYRYQREVAMSRLRDFDFERTTTFSIPEFEAEPVPGPFINGLDRTDESLELEAKIKRLLEE